VSPVSLTEHPAIGNLIHVLRESLQNLQLGLVRGAKLSEGTQLSSLTGSVFLSYLLLDLLWSHLNLHHLCSIYLDYGYMFGCRFGEAESLGGHVLALLSQITSFSVMEIHLQCDPIVMRCSRTMYGQIWRAFLRNPSSHLCRGSHFFLLEHSIQGRLSNWFKQVWWM
jgi:hypothetical protein